MTSYKKGYCTGAKTQAAADQLSRLNVEWFYTWGKSPNMGQPISDFTPMIWGASSATDLVIQEIESNLWRYRSTRLLGFNEPDRADQANMSVDKALSLWPVLEKSSLKLVSPATESPNRAWMNDFMTRALAQGRRIDAVACHIYQSPDSVAFLRKVDELYARWGKPVWVTETAVADWSASATVPNRYTRPQVDDYLAEIYAGILARPHVQRFAWKTRPITDPNMGVSSFFEADGVTLTSTGRLYASL